MGRLCNQVSIISQIDEHLPIFVILIEDRPHLVAKMNPHVIVFVLLFDSIVRTNQPPLRNGERRVNSFDDTSENRIRINKVVSQSVQVVYVVLFIQQDRPVIQLG